MSATAYLPVHCCACRRVRLQRVQAGAMPCCSACHGPATITPGQAYVEADGPLFDGIDVAIHAARLQRGAAQRLANMLADVALQPQGVSRVLSVVVELVPGLHFLLEAMSRRKIAGSAAVDLVRVSGMVLISVRARLRETDSDCLRESTA